MKDKEREIVIVSGQNSHSASSRIVQYSPQSHSPGVVPLCKTKCYTKSDYEKRFVAKMYN